MDTDDQDLDERDRQDREEWERQQHGAMSQQKKQPAPAPPTSPSSPNSKQTDWSVMLDRSYKLTSIRAWVSRFVSACFVAGLFYTSWVFALPWLIDYAEFRYNENFRAPFYSCGLIGSDALYEKSDLFKDYYNYRRFEMRLYQHTAWELDGALRRKYPDKAFIFEIPPMPKNYNRNQESYKTYKRFIHPEKSARFYFDVDNNRSKIKVIEKDEAYCSLPSAPSTKPTRVNEYIKTYGDKPH